MTYIYYHDSATERSHAKNPLGVVGKSQSLHKTTSPRPNKRILGQYALVYVYEGGGFYEDENLGKTNVCAGDLILLFPELAHNYGPMGGQIWKEFFIVFNGDVFELWQKQGLLSHAQPIIHLEPIDYWLQKMRGTLNVEGPENSDKTLRQLCGIQSFIAEALQHSHTETKGIENAIWLKKASALLEEAETVEIDYLGICQQLGVSYSTFRKRFTQLSGIAPGKYHFEALIKKAGDILCHENLSNRDIAERLGFSDEFHFSRRFKQITGVSPKAFRRSHLLS